MKSAAKCDRHCELQNSVNQWGLECILCFWDIPESMPASVSSLSPSKGTAATVVVPMWVVSVCVGESLDVKVKCFP